MSYSQLQADIADFLNRQDLNAAIFIRLAEARFNRVIRTREMITRSIAEVDTQFTVLPPDFQDLRNIQLNADTIRSLQFATPQYMDKLRIQNKQGLPESFTIIGNQIELYPSPPETVEIEIAYYAKIPALSDDNPSNWLLENHYDLYLYGSLAQTAPYLKEDERLAVWGDLALSAINELKLEDDRHNFMGTTPQQRQRAIG